MFQAFCRAVVKQEASQKSSSVGDQFVTMFKENYCNSPQGAKQEFQ